MAFAGCGRCHFDLGITHFDLANNYGLVYGSAEENFGRIMESDMRPYRDEVLIATKAGHDMWKGPYGDGGSRKYLMASLDQSLKNFQVQRGTNTESGGDSCPEPYTAVDSPVPL